MASYETGEILPPTPEDVAIFQRNFQRMLRWMADFGHERDGLKPLAKWCGDYLHRKN